MLETVAWYALTLVVRVLDKGREIERERWADEKTEKRSELCLRGASLQGCFGNPSSWCIFAHLARL